MAVTVMVGLGIVVGMGMRVMRPVGRDRRDHVRDTPW